MDASKEIKELTDVIAINTAIATLGPEWSRASVEEIDERATNISFMVVEVLRHREKMRALYD